MVNKRARRLKIKKRINKKIRGTADTPRLAIYRSNKSIYCQIIRDVDGITLTSASSKDDGIEKSGTKSEQAKKVGTLIAGKASALNIENITFDRGGYLYHGRVKALADGAREGGLKF